MENISVPVYDENNVKQRSIFTVNDRIQVVFITDLKTGKKLDDDYNVNEYLQAVIQAHLLKLHGISDPQQITSIVRTDELDAGKITVVIALDVVTNVQEGVDELRCSISEEGLYTETEEENSAEETLIPWNHELSEISDPLNVIQGSSTIIEDSIAGPTLRWTSEMTSLLIQVRGDMDVEFTKTKYKFRLWERVAMKLNESLLNIKVTAKDCDDKWRNIVATYRKNIDKMKSFGDNSVRWEYFAAMDNILKGTRDLVDFPDNLSSEYLGFELANGFNQSDVLTNGDPFDVIDLNPDQMSSVEEIEIDETDESSQDCIITRKHNGEKRKWTTQQCLMLLHLRNQADEKFKEVYDNAPYLWRDLACQMNANFLSNFSASELESVWKHCIINYDINLENLKSKGVNTVKWKYFAVMDEIRGGTQQISDICVPKPGEYLLKDFQKLSQKNPSYILNVDPSCLTISCKDETDSEEASFPSYSGISWTQDMVKMLISLKKLIEKEIVQHRISRKKQWWVMVRRFRTLKNVRLTEEACEEKWRNLVRTYKKNLVRVKKRGTGVIRWPYFWKMHEIMGNLDIENDIKPVPYVELSANRMRLTESVTADIRSKNNRSVLINDQSLENTESISDDITDQNENLSNIICDLRDKQNKMLQEIINIQNKKIEELHKEQLNIKALLTQLLQKFP